MRTTVRVARQHPEQQHARPSRCRRACAVERATRVVLHPPRRRRQHLHRADRVGAGHDAHLPARLLPRDRQRELRVDVVVAGRAGDHPAHLLAVAVGVLPHRGAALAALLAAVLAAVLAALVAAVAPAAPPGSRSAGRRGARRSAPRWLWDTSSAVHAWNRTARPEAVSPGWTTYDTRLRSSGSRTWSACAGAATAGDERDGEDQPERTAPRTSAVSERAVGARSRGTGGAPRLAGCARGTGALREGSARTSIRR